MDLSQKTVVITGSTSGLGLALARAFLGQNANVIISSESSSETQKISRELNTPGRTADVTDPQAVDELARFAVKKFGSLDIWINNAGIWLPHDNFENFEPTKLELMLKVNTLGTFYGCQSALRHMKKQNSGIICNISSTSALRPRPHSVAYAASKSALTQLADSLNAELKKEPIQVLTIYPGKMQTALFEEADKLNLSNAMSPNLVAEKIIQNLQKDSLQNKLVIPTPDAT